MCRTMGRTLWHLLCCTGLVFSTGTPCLAATFTFRPEYVARGGPVLLGQIAEITECDETTRNALGSLELFPAPPLGEVRFVTQQDIREILTLRGIDTTVHMWNGAPRVRIVTSPQPQPVGPARTQEPREASIPSRQRADSRVKRAIQEYLKEHYPQMPPQDVMFTLADEDVRWLNAADVQVRMHREQIMSPDRRIFFGTIYAPGGQRNFQVEARLSPKPRVVVAARPLPRDTVVAPEDVRLAEDVPPGQDYATRLEAVLGRQLTTAVAPGKPITLSSLRDPILIKRGELVQVSVRAPGVIIRTLGRAKDDGPLGHLVPVEILDNRGKTVLGKVVDHQLVEIYAGSSPVQQVLR